METRTLLHVLLEAPELNCASWPKFQVLWTRMAAAAAERHGEPRLARVQVSQPTFKRWRAGLNMPRGEMRLILESFFDRSVEELSRLVPVRKFVVPRPADRRTRTAARALDHSWGTSRHVPGSPEAGVDGVWQLSGGRHFDGTTIGVQLYEAEPRGRLLELGEADLAHLRTFIRSSRRGVLLASPGAAGGSGLYVLDAAIARQSLASGQTPHVPTAYRLDDLTYAITWALHILDDGLLADDSALADRSEELTHYAAIRTSAPSRSEMPDLSRVGAAWLGSRLCAKFIVRHLDHVTEVPAFWTRETTGEECAPWLLFRHKHDYLKSLSQRFTGNADPLGRAFCIPEAAVSSSETYERILLFLTVAMMQMHGITVWMTAAPELQQVDGFVLAKDRAILANWVREEAVWRVSTTSARRDVAPYQEAIGHARTHNLLNSESSTGRLHALAEYLGLDWAWLSERCRGLAEEGIDHMVRPRSRLLTLTALDETLRYVGGLGRQDHER
ncbi:transcriptional regulator, XRE family protein [Streptomyces sp. NPDC055103]